MEDEATPDLKNHPDYSDGFWEADAGLPCSIGASDAYRAGWEAYHRAARILADAGFKRNGNQFSKTMIVRP